MGKRSNFDRIPHDFYVTPLAAVLPLIPHLHGVRTFAEPCCGDGALVRHLEAQGLHCANQGDITAGQDALTLDSYGDIDAIITNAPWTRNLLHPLITHLQRIAPTWLLLDADWANTKQAVPYLRHCTDILAIGRVIWIPGTSTPGKDNAAWYRFNASHATGPRFHAYRSAPDIDLCRHLVRRELIMTIDLSRATLSLEPINVSINEMIERASLAKHASDTPRGYLGASLIGDECSRKVQFEWLCGSSFPARVRSIFARGHFFEAESKQQLVDAGFVFAPTEALGFIAAGGLMAGHADGIIDRVPEELNPHFATPSVWECKGLNAKNFRAVERDGLAKVFPKYAAQVALYQAFLRVTNPALITIINADTCERLHFTVEFDARLAQEASDRAVHVIEATRAGELLPRLDPSLEDFRCKFCSHRNRCERYD
jgi:hypothetical protein